MLRIDTEYFTYKLHIFGPHFLYGVMLTDTDKHPVKTLAFRLNVLSQRLRPSNRKQLCC